MDQHVVVCIGTDALYPLISTADARCPTTALLGRAEVRCPTGQRFSTIGAIACASIRAKHWRHGRTVSVVPAEKKATSNIWSHHIDLAAAVWGTAALATFALWGWLVWWWLPTSWSSTAKLVEHGLTFSLHIVFMDVVPNWLTGLCLHRIPFLERYEHRWEHCITKAGKLSSLFLVTTLYAWYTLLFMAAFGLGVACSSPAGGSCFHWESVMWLASFVYALVGLLLRLVFWRMRHFPAMYKRHPVLLKMSRFYWAHFHFKEWSGGVVFGASTPFYDVVFGTCPFDIKWSVPIPFVDFLLCEQRIFETVRHPRKIKWTVWQWAWHAGWLVLIACSVLALAVLQAFGYFTAGARDSAQ